MAQVGFCGHIIESFDFMKGDLLDHLAISFLRKSTNLALLNYANKKITENRKKHSVGQKRKKSENS
jgi:hypothetical protein